jgi:hypothetical protein
MTAFDIQKGDLEVDATIFNNINNNNIIQKQIQ